MAHNHKVKILGIDPGLTTCGWNLSEYDAQNECLTVLKIGEFHPGPTVDKKNYRDLVEKFDKRTISLSYIREQLTKLLVDFKPDAVCAEDIFINVRRPAAYGALAMFICVAKMTCMDAANKRLVTIPTKIAKSVLTRSGSSDKLTVQQCVIKNNTICFKDPSDPMHMSEHEADSIAVSFAFVKVYRDLILAMLEPKDETT